MDATRGESIVGNPNFLETVYLNLHSLKEDELQRLIGAITIELMSRSDQYGREMMGDEDV